MTKTQTCSPSFALNFSILNLPKVILKPVLYCSGLLLVFISLSHSHAQVTDADRHGFTWIMTEETENTEYGAGYSFYTPVWPLLNEYPGPVEFQTGLASAWMSTQRTGTEPEDFYTTIEGGLGWWSDTRFGTKTPKFIMGGVSSGFYSWANGPGAGQSDLIETDQRDWSQPGGKYGVAQLSNSVVWPPDGLNMAQGLNGQMLGYGYQPLPLTNIIEETAGSDITTGNQCWTLFFNAANFKGPVSFFLPTFWTEPVVEESPELEGLFLDTRPANPNVGLGFELGETPALMSFDENDVPYAKVPPLQYPLNDGDRTELIKDINIYTFNALWNDMETWFDGGAAVMPGTNAGENQPVVFADVGSDFVGEIILPGQDGEDFPVDLYAFTEPFSDNGENMGFEWNFDYGPTLSGLFVTPEYWKFENNEEWIPITAAEVPASANLVGEQTPTTPRNDDLPYLTPMEDDCHWQEPGNAWVSPGPTQGPFYAYPGDGSRITYYWYKFIDQPAVIHANLSEEDRAALQQRVELIHSNWNNTSDYLDPPSEETELASLDAALVLTPPPGLEVGYVPIVTRQEKAEEKVRVFIMAGQSNMQGQGIISEEGNQVGTLVDVIANDTDGNWPDLGTEDNWNTLDNVWLYFDRPDDLIQGNVTVGQGAYDELIGPELMFAHKLDEYYDDPVVIIKTAWGGKNLAVDFRPPSAEGETGEFYTEMIETVQDVTLDLANLYPEITQDQFEISGFVWFQGWNDGEEQAYMDEYESNLRHLVEDVRNDLVAFDLPIVIANSGHGGPELSDDLWVQDLQTIVAPAQEAVGCDDNSYGGILGFTDTQPFYIDENNSPSEAIHHFNDNALTYLNIGAVMGDEMVRCLNNMAFCSSVNSVENIEAKSKNILIYPNPAQDRITLESKGLKIYSLRVINSQGKLVTKLTNVSETTLTLDLEGAQGIYLFQIEWSDGSISAYPIIKQ